MAAGESSGGGEMVVGAATFGLHERREGGGWRASSRRVCVIGSEGAVLLRLQVEREEGPAGPTTPNCGCGGRGGKQRRQR